MRLRIGCTVTLLCVTVFTAGAAENVLSQSHRLQTSPIEAAVLDEQGGVLIALPVLSYPFVAQQFSNENGGFENRMSPSDLVLKSNKKNCRSTLDCDLPISVVAKHHHMRITPTMWFDSNGSKYSVRKGRIFETGVGSGIGFDLGPAPAGKRKTLLLSDVSGFPSTRSIPQSEWSLWKELATDLNEWAVLEINKCENSSDCKHVVNMLASPSKLKGNAREFSLPDGRKLQFLTASSSSGRSGVLVKRPEYMGEGESEADTLEVYLWRMVSPDGNVRILRLGGDQGFTSDHWSSGTGLNYPYCESQCTGGIDGVEVFFVGGRTFVFGHYWGGTVYGYIFLEVLPAELKRLGEYSWGS